MTVLEIEEEIKRKIEKDPELNLAALLMDYEQYLTHNQQTAIRSWAISYRNKIRDGKAAENTAQHSS